MTDQERPEPVDQPPPQTVGGLLTMTAEAEVIRGNPTDEEDEEAR